MRTIALVAGTLLGGMSLAGTAAADPEGPPGPGFGPPPGPPPIDRILERHAAELGLSDAVRAQVREIADASRAQEQPLFGALDEQRDALHALLAQDAPDLDAVLRQAEIVGAAETELHKQRLRTLLAVRALLTPEQRATLVRIFEERRGDMRHGWRMRPPDSQDEPVP